MVETDERDAAPATEKALLADVCIDRDLGWLDFNRPVLAEAEDPRTPLLERAKFLAIFTSNLDEDHHTVNDEITGARQRLDDVLLDEVLLDTSRATRNNRGGFYRPSLT